MRVCFFLLMSTITIFFSFSVHSATQEEIQIGAQVWRTNCASCHGADGRGSPQIKQQLNGEIVDFTSLAFAETVDRKKMLLAVRDGVKETLMPSFRAQLSYQEMLAVVDYARNSFMLQLNMGHDYDEGKKVFADNCSVCHGDQGQGAIWTSAGLFPKPANFTDPKKIKQLTKTRMLFSVTNGRPETAMVSWKTRLSTQQITAVVNYIRAGIMKVSDRETEFGDAMGEQQNKLDPFLSGKNFDESDLSSAPVKKTNKVEQSSTSKNNPSDPFLQSGAYQVSEDPNIGKSDIYGGESHDHNAHMGKKLNILDPLPNGLIGDYDAGRDLYGKTCISCHGKKGNGQGPRAHFIFPKPRDFTHSAARASFSRAHIFERIRAGVIQTEMPAWGSVLTQQQMANVAEYVFSTFISQKRIDPDFWPKQDDKNKLINKVKSQ